MGAAEISDAGMAPFAALAATPYLPAGPVARAMWFARFAARLPAYANMYGLTPAEVDAVVLGQLSFAATLAQLAELSAFANTTTAFRTALRAASRHDCVPGPAPTWPGAPAGSGVFGAVAAAVAKITAHPAFGTAPAEALGLTGTAAASPRPAGVRPALALGTVRGRHPVLRWRKQRQPVLAIEVDRGAGWQPLTLSRLAHYVDAHALPAVSTQWRYRAIYHNYGCPVGQWSETVMAVVMASPQPARPATAGRPSFVAPPPLSFSSL